jgi:hypothetical protein
VKRKSGCGCGPGLLAFGLFVAVVAGGHYLAIEMDQRRFPWGYADSGKRPLVGTWVGPVTTGSGKRLGMLVDIELVPLGRGRRYTPIIRNRRHAWLEGRVLVCDGPGRVRHLEASGEPNDNRASSFHLGTSPTDSVPPPEGLAPSHLYGRFDGSDSLAFEASLYLRRGTSAITGSDDPDTGRRTRLTLRRGTDTTFNSLCGRL